ncbi:MAG: hypothetical protein JNM07_01420 [Phycisphaerae bacterium]|nr:hypothetical protein [Phycisphaerae bacterium]
MMPLSIATSLLAALLAPSPPGPTAPDPDAGLALVRGFEAYDASIETISYRQVLYRCPSSNTPDPQLRRWFALNESERALSAQRHFVHHYTFHGYAEDEQAWLDLVARTAGDATWKIGWSVDEGRGILNQPDLMLPISASLTRMLGRFIDYGAPRESATLAEQLRAATRAAYLPPSEGEPWPGFRVDALINKGWVDVEVRVDPAHGFVPRLLRVLRHHDQFLIETLVAPEIADADGTWIPTVVIQCIREQHIVRDVAHPVPPGQAADMRLAPELEGLPEPLRTPEVRAWVARLSIVGIADAEKRLADGPTGFWSDDTEVSQPQIARVTDVRVNRAWDTGDYFAGLDPAGRMFNGCTMSRSDVKSVRRFLETKLMNGTSP